jgi:uncharacterized membrane protein
MSRSRWLRLGTKALHEIASIGFGGALAACLVINLMANRAAAAEFATARHVFAAIAQYVLVPSMAIVVVSGLISMAATLSFQGASWVWAKALLGLSVFQATLLIGGSSRKLAEHAAVGGDPMLIDSLLRSERITLWLLIAISVANVVLAVWRPRLTGRPGGPGT